MIRIAIVEDNRYLLDTLRTELGHFAEIEVVFASTNGVECLAEMDKRKSEALPEVILMDISMPKMDGIETTSRIRILYPFVQVLMLTVLDNEEKIFEAIQAGAKGYLLKEEKNKSIVAAIQEIKNGGTILTPSVARKALDFMQKNFLLANLNQAEIRQESAQTLTLKETEIMIFLSQGLSYQHIANETNISVNTLKKHIYNIYEKLEVHNKVQAINKFRQI